MDCDPDLHFVLYGKWFDVFRPEKDLSVLLVVLISHALENVHGTVPLQESQVRDHGLGLRAFKRPHHPERASLCSLVHHFFLFLRMRMLLGHWDREIVKEVLFRAVPESVLNQELRLLLISVAVQKLLAACDIS